MEGRIKGRRWRGKIRVGVSIKERKGYQLMQEEIQDREERLSGTRLIDRFTKEEDERTVFKQYSS